MSFELKKLPYAEDALEPYISAKTVSFHYNKHHKGYVDKLNSLTMETDYARMPLEKVVILSHEKGAVAIFNNAGQVWNHDFYWQSMTHKSTAKPSLNSRLYQELTKCFGTVERFLEEFIANGTAQFGSGWVWLVSDNGTLKITKTANADSPLLYKQIPLLTMDVWEHAYYLDTQNRRVDYMQSFTQNLINWEFAEQNLSRQ